MIENKPKEIEEYEAEWDPVGVSKCRPCHIGINDAGCYQCRDCLMDYSSAPKEVIKELKDLRGEELWKIDYNRLKKTQRLVRNGSLYKLIEQQISYRDKNGNPTNKRTFYELG